MDSASYQSRVSTSTKQSITSRNSNPKGMNSKAVNERSFLYRPTTACEHLTHRESLLQPYTETQKFKLYEKLFQNSFGNVNCQKKKFLEDKSLGGNLKKVYPKNYDCQAKSILKYESGPSFKQEYVTPKITLEGGSLTARNQKAVSASTECGNSSFINIYSYDKQKVESCSMDSLALGLLLELLS